MKSQVKEMNPRMRIAQCTVLLMGLLFTMLSYAGGSESLRIFYDQTHAMTANFHQIVTDSKGRKIQEVHGEMLLKRPNQFRWDYQKPFEQQIVSDGKRVWLYDTDLEQVTVSKVSKALGSSPAALLAGDDNIDQSFVLRDFNKDDDLAWVSVAPKSDSTGFNQIELAFNRQHLLQKMKLVDSFGQHTNIVFSNQMQNPVLNAKEFLFEVPEGVDVVGE
jgi:outer membrane lipoprotein carrier protein